MWPFRKLPDATASTAMIWPVGERERMQDLGGPRLRLMEVENAIGHVAV